MITITITIDDEEVEHSLPSKKEVCSDCNGEGYVLCEGMRGHAYSMEEFNEAFDEEDRAAYFQRGGKYDVVCTTCNGNNVVDVIDEENLNTSQKEIYNIYSKQEEQRAAEERMYEAECRMERMMGC